jgi:hypothetical protein
MSAGHDERLVVVSRFNIYRSPKNHDICVQFEHTKQVADLFAQSKLKNVAIDVFS